MTMSKVPYNIQQLAQSLGYLTVEYVLVFGEYDVYQCHSIKRGSYSLCAGLPTYILSNQEIVRLATFEETLDILSV